MSIKSQTANMRKLAEVLKLNLSYDGLVRDQKIFLTKSAAFLRMLKKDLGLSEAKVSIDGCAAPGYCSLIGMWENTGIYIQICKWEGIREKVLLYREVRNMKDYSGGINRFVTRDDLQHMSYNELLTRLLTIKDSPLFAKQDK